MSDGTEHEGGEHHHDPWHTAGGTHAILEGAHATAEGVMGGSRAVSNMWGAVDKFASGASNTVPAITSDASAFARGFGAGGGSGAHIAAEGFEHSVHGMTKAMGGGAEAAEMAEMMTEIEGGTLRGAASRMSGMNVAGGLLGAAGIGIGIHDMWKGGSELVEAGGDVTSTKGSQGGLDLLAGGLGTAAGVGGVSSALVAGGLASGSGLAGTLAGSLACPPVAIAAALAGLGAVGNAGAQKDGWYGTHKNAEGKDENSTFFGSIGESGSAGFKAGEGAGHALLGNNWAGDAAGAVLGTVGGGLAGAGQSVWNAGAAVTHGVMDVGSAIGGGLKSAGSAILSFLSDARLKDGIATIDGATALELLTRS